MNETNEASRRAMLRWSIALTIIYVLSNVFFMDIGLHDETTFYLSRKEDLSLSVFLTRAEYGPLYAAWYKLLSLLVRDNLALYFVSWCVLVALSIQLMRIATHSVGSAIPMLLMLGPRILKVWPYVGLFAGALILWGFIVAKSRKSTQSAILVTSVSGFVVGLARPEFLYAPAMLLLGYIAFSLVRRQVNVKTLLICTAIAAAGLVISRNSDTGRGGVALEQHFNLRASERGELGDEVPWTSSHARVHFFGNPDRTVKYKLSEYIKADPVAVAKHFLGNALDPRTLLLALACGGIAFLLARIGMANAGLYIAVMSLPPLISCVLIYPRDHYIVAILLTLIAGGSIVAAHFLSGQAWADRLKRPLLVAMVLLVLAFPLARKTWKLPFEAMSRQGFAAVHPFLSTALELRTLEREDRFKKPLVMFEPYGGFHHYLTGSWRWIPEFHVKSKDQLLTLIRGQTTSAFMVNQYVLDYYKIPAQELEQTFRDSGYMYRSCTHLPCAIWIAPK